MSTKARADAWYASLDEEQLWQLYSMAKRSQWFEVVKVAREEMGVTENVSRSAYYRWLDYMRGEESEHRLALARIAATEANDLAASVGVDDEKAIAAYKSLAAEMALRTGSAKEASKFLQMAMDLTDRRLKTIDLHRKDEELKIAQEKLRIEQAKNAKAVETLKEDKLTPDEREAKLKEIFGL